jgi:hypothetical protein
MPLRVESVRETHRNLRLDSGRTDHYLDSNKAIPFVVSAVEPRNVSHGHDQQTQTEPLPAGLRRHALYVLDGPAA